MRFHDFLVFLLVDTPVPTRVEVVDRVVAIVVAKEIQHFSGEVARKIVSRGIITTIMLKKIKSDDTRLGKCVRKDYH